MIVDVIVDFVGLPYNPTKLLAILQFPIPSCSKHRRGYTTYTCQTMEKVVLIALFHSHTHKHILTLSLSLSLFSISISLLGSHFRLDTDFSFTSQTTDEDEVIRIRNNN